MESCELGMQSSGVVAMQWSGLGWSSSFSLLDDGTLSASASSKCGSPYLPSRWFFAESSTSVSTSWEYYDLSRLC
jgi:hypothetical protein